MLRASCTWIIQRFSALEIDLLLNDDIFQQKTGYKSMAQARQPQASLINYGGINNNGGIN